MEFILNNWAELLLALITLAGTITALTETETDDKWLDVVKRVLNAVLLGKAKK
jgi:hypothetical protein